MEDAMMIADDSPASELEFVADVVMISPERLARLTAQTDWQQASELFMPLRNKGVNLSMIYTGSYCVRLDQWYSLGGDEYPQQRKAKGIGASFTEAMEKAISEWEATYGQ